jgi:hypothetical protein
METIYFSKMLLTYLQVHMALQPTRPRWTSSWPQKLKISDITPLLNKLYLLCEGLSSRIFKEIQRNITICSVILG